MVVLILGLLLFLGVHSAQILDPDIRSRVIKRGGGVGAWLWPYTSISATGFVLLIVGYALARSEAAIIYRPLPELRYLTLGLMLPVFPLLLATYIKGRIGQVVGHPMLIATILWGSSHLLANGSMADLLLFGGFLLWGTADWHSVVTRQSGNPRRSLTWTRNDTFAVLGGVTLYSVFVGGLHVLLFGVSPT